MNKDSSLRKKIFHPLVIAIAAILVIVIFITGRTKKHVFKVGYVTTGSSFEDGWNGSQCKGVSAACKKLGVKLIMKENVPEERVQLEQVVSSMLEEGVEMVFLASYNYPAQIFDLIKENPSVPFYTMGGDVSAGNITKYFIRMYQARYISGVIAGLKTQTNEIGYVAAMKNNEVNRGASAFALGVQSVNPDAKVYIKWTNSWDDPEKEIQAVQSLVKNTKVDLFTYHQNQPNVVYAADSMNIDSIGYMTELTDASPRLLTSIVCFWDKTYEALIRQNLQGKKNSSDFYWLGLNDGVVKLSDYSANVTKEMKEKVKQAEERIKNGNDVFSDKIYDTDGILRCDEGEILSDSQLLNDFNWLVKGIEIYEGK